ncbi:DUF2931 family protein [Chryseobacterium profundimaris]|uniref:DUF2931 family protein n=1 Tax=Chryseobacterium profundimaris TaxID=1387275 RepID=A0ABY1PK45_9FLAO|nr:DUF2931 family protein [Chryseobacterium profundimaris]SMP35807.1 Protein of unknown function [Chryseobacterium profundimaris]
MDKWKALIIALGMLQLMNCQDMKKKDDMPMPTYDVQISHPWNNYLITPVEDKIITLEGVPAGLPYGSSSGTWGDSGKGFTEQSGTPVGADIVYFSRYEDTFYHLKADFPKDKVKELVDRAYANSESDSSDEPMKEFISIKQEPDYSEKYNKAGMAYYKFGTLVFGFAPKGMVVVWFKFGYVSVQLGEFQAEVVKDDKKYADKLFSKISQTREEIKKNMFIPDASPKEWKNYQKRYFWSPSVISENEDFRLFKIQSEYYNGEREIMLRPWAMKPPMKERAVPKEITFFWETAKGQAYEGRAFFNWENANEVLEKAGKDFKLNIKVAPDNSNMEIMVNEQKIPVDSTRIYASDLTFKESY